MKTLSLGALAMLLLLGKDCGHGAQRRLPPRPAGPPPRIDPATLPSIPVHPESPQGVDESRIYHQLGPGAPPRLIARKDIEYPPDHRPWGRQPGVLIVEAVIPPDGRIARIKVLKGLGARRGPSRMAVRARKAVGGAGRGVLHPRDSGQREEAGIVSRPAAQKSADFV